MAWIAREEMDGKEGLFLAQRRSLIVLLLSSCSRAASILSLFHGLAFAMLEQFEALTLITSGFYPQQGQGCVENGGWSFVGSFAVL